jgi:hypothetical protein
MNVNAKYTVTKKGNPMLIVTKNDGDPVLTLVQKKDGEVHVNMGGKSLTEVGTMVIQALKTAWNAGKNRKDFELDYQQRKDGKSAYAFPKIRKG